VRLWAEGQEPKAIAWEKGFSFAVQGLPAGSYHWSVAVVREAGTQADGSKKWEAVSQVSQVLTFGHFPTTTSYSASLRHPPTALQLGKTGALLGLGLVLGLFLVPAGPGWLRHCRRRR